MDAGEQASKGGPEGRLIASGKAVSFEQEAYWPLPYGVCESDVGSPCLKDSPAWLTLSRGGAWMGTVGVGHIAARNAGLTGAEHENIVLCGIEKGTEDSEPLIEAQLSCL